MENKELENEQYQTSLFDDNCKTIKDYENIVVDLLPKLNKDLPNSGYVIKNITRTKFKAQYMQSFTVSIRIDDDEWVGVKKELASNRAYKILLKKIRNTLYLQMVHELGRLLEITYLNDRPMYMYHSSTEKMLAFLTAQTETYLKKNVTLYMSKLEYLPFNKMIVIRPKGFRGCVNIVIVAKTMFEFSTKLLEKLREYLHKENQLDTIAYYENKNRRYYSFEDICDRRRDRVRSNKTISNATKK